MRLLTIQKKHYDAILAGTKRTELRGINNRTKFLLDYEFDHIGFHYYRKNRIICAVEKIRQIKTPEHVRGLHGIGDLCIEIKLGFTFERIKT